DGPNGITQFNQGCWFECSLAALTMTPRGQELISGMIHSTDGGQSYVVRFPGEPSSHTITAKKMEEYRVRDKALWATLLHCAEIQKYQNGAAAWNLRDGLSWLTGKRAEQIYASNTTEQALVDFIGGAVKANNPVVCEAL